MVYRVLTYACFAFVIKYTLHIGVHFSAYPRKFKRSEL